MLLWWIQLSEAYVLVGFLVSLAFVWRGVGRVDPVAGEGTLGFRILILPACTVLWPYVLLRWIRAGRSPEASGAHR